LLKFSPKTTEILSDAQFRTLVISQALFDLAISMGGSVNSWVIFEITQSQLWVGLVAGARAIPFLIFALLGGVISDRFGRKNLMIGSLSLFAIAAATTAILIANELLVAWHMIAVSLIGAIGGALYGPAFFAFVADIVHSDRLSNANGIISVARTTGEMLGPMIVGFIIAVSGADTVFWLIVVGNFFGLLLLTRIREPSRIENLNEPIKLTFFAQMAEGLQYARNTPPLLWLTLLVIAQNLFGSAIFAVMPTYAVDILKIGPTGFGLMGGVLGAGMLIGAVFVSIYGIHHRHAYVMLTMGVVWDIGMIIFGFSRSIPLSLGALFFMGLITMPWSIAVLTMFQRASIEKMRGRVMSLYVIAINTFPLGWLFGGAVAEWLGNEEALVISAALGTPVAGIALILSKELRRA
jgi:MFS family permease